MVSEPILYRERLVERSLDELFSQLAALIVVGPRAVGKTTTLGRRAATIVRLDRPQQAAVFDADPDVALAGLPEPVLVDEWQMVPSVLGALKRAVDADPRPGRFLVTGSVRAERERQAWPGTGRLVRVEMHPMTVREQQGRIEGPTVFDRLIEGADLSVPATSPDLRGYVELALRSGFPDPALRLDPQARRAWLEGYIDDLLTHDLEQLESSATRRRDTQRLRRYFVAFALNSAGVADHRTIYDAAEVSRVTATVYEDLLERLLLVQLIPAWTSNRLKRLVLRPKRYLVDAALLAAALGLDEDGVMRDGDVLGRLLETFVLSQLRAELQLSAARPRLYHLRTAQGRHEIDLVAEIGGQRLIALEVKATAAPNARRDAKHLAWLRDELGDRFVRGIVFHTGPRVFVLDDRIVAAPISALWA
jgi:predicted AAA+ superfamily ATPase